MSLFYSLTHDAEVIEFYGRINGWTPEKVREQVLNVFNKRDVSNYSKVDLVSIMMYVLYLVTAVDALLIASLIGTSCRLQ